MRAVRHKRADVIRQFIRGECAVAVDNTNYADFLRDVEKANPALTWLGSEPIGNWHPVQSSAPSVIYIFKSENGSEFLSCASFRYSYFLTQSTLTFWSKVCGN